MFENKMLRDAYGNITFLLEGDLNFSHGQKLQDYVCELLAENPQVELNFDFTKVELVGSTGVSHFVDTIKFFQDHYTNRKIRLANVSPYFKRLFKVYDLDSQELYCDFGISDELTASLNKKYGNRKYTYEN